MMAWSVEEGEAMRARMMAMVGALWMPCLQWIIVGPDRGRMECARAVRAGCHLRGVGLQYPKV